MKDFENWFPVKSKLNEGVHKPPYVSEGDIWWASIGQNVGSEIGGKSKQFTRPVIILKNYLTAFILLYQQVQKKKMAVGM